MSEWISVLDVLPPMHEKVLVILKDWVFDGDADRHEGEEMVSDIFFGVFVEERKWQGTEKVKPHFDCYGTETPYDKITTRGQGSGVMHWMPLPDTNTRKKNDNI